MILFDAYENCQQNDSNIVIQMGKVSEFNDCSKWLHQMLTNNNFNKMQYNAAKQLIQEIRSYETNNKTQSKTIHPKIPIIEEPINHDNNKTNISTNTVTSIKMSTNKTDDQSADINKDTNNKKKKRNKKRECPVCKIKCSSKNSLWNHILEQHDGNTGEIKCSQTGCVRKFATEKEMLLHFGSVHARRTTIDPKILCPKGLKSGKKDDSCCYLKISCNKLRVRCSDAKCGFQQRYKGTNASDYSYKGQQARN